VRKNTECKLTADACLIPSNGACGAVRGAAMAAGGRVGGGGGRLKDVFSSPRARIIGDELE
jgi:hypothetical protein